MKPAWREVGAGLPKPGFRVLIFCDRIVNIGVRSSQDDRWVTLYPYAWIFDRDEAKREKKGEPRKVTHWADLPGGPE